MVKAIEVPEDDEDKLRIVIFACENDAYPALDMAGMRHNKISHMIRVVPVRCLGSVNMAWVRDLLSAGMDGAMLLGCKYGDIISAILLRAQKLPLNGWKISVILSTLGLEPERVRSEQLPLPSTIKFLRFSMTLLMRL